MNKEITYSGYAANTPGYNCPDGEFDAVMDLWPENGAYKPVLPPNTVMTLSSGYKVVYIHRPNSSTNNYILYYESGSTRKIYWRESAASIHELTSFSSDIFKNVIALGNTLLVITTEGVRYLLWSGAGYTYLGDHLPELDLSFGLQSEYIRSEYADLGISFVSTEELRNLSESAQTIVTSRVMASVNKFIADNATNSGKFLFPFFVRYAYRLYDGTLTMQSAPILMHCANGPVPLVAMRNASQIGYYEYCTLGMLSELDYITQAAQKTALGGWGDIVKSVDIFISAPIYTIDQAGTIKHILNTESSDASIFTNYIICKWTNSPKTSTRNKYASYNIEKVFPYNENVQYYEKIILPEKSQFSLEEEYGSQANFYLLKSINIDELATTRTKIEVPSDYLQSLVNREMLPDDWDSHDNLISLCQFTYNQRMNLANLEKDIFRGYHPQSMVTFSETQYSWTYSNSAWSTSENQSVLAYRFVYYINYNGKEIIVENNTQRGAYSPGSGIFGQGAWFGTFLYFPNTNVKKITIVQTINGGFTVTSKTYDMKPHGLLNGSFFASAHLGSIVGSDTIPAVSADRKISMPNKLYTSEVNNPFYFPVTNINTVGVGEIIGISAAAKPMSLGQFGQFPLYVFSTDGIWAMEVSSTGGYSAKQPISMEVCKPGTITQLDNSVAFSTSRGVMLISGSNVQCISETIDNKSDAIFVVSNSSLPGSASILSSDTTRLSSFISFREFLNNAKTIFDCVSQRLILFNPQKTYAYIFAMDGSKQWGMMRSSIVSEVNSYPNAMAMTSDNKLIDLSYRGTNGTPTNYQLLVTRPLKLDMPNVLKRITSVIQRGNFSKHPNESNPNPVQGVLYGSRDLANWFQVWSSTDEIMRGFHGTPYKYYRILLRCYLRDTESLLGCSIEYTPELTNQPR